jgi:hypothetical protein
MTDKTPTPLTDAWPFWHVGGKAVVDREFARHLERSLAAAQAALRRIEVLDAEIMYERCPDCDRFAGCNETKRCRISPLSQIGQIAHDALTPQEGERDD